MAGTTKRRTQAAKPKSETKSRAKGANARSTAQRQASAEETKSPESSAGVLDQARSERAPRGEESETIVADHQPLDKGAESVEVAPAEDRPKGLLEQRLRYENPLLARVPLLPTCPFPSRRASSHSLEWRWAPVCLVMGANFTKQRNDYRPKVRPAEVGNAPAAKGTDLQGWTVGHGSDKFRQPCPQGETNKGRRQGGPQHPPRSPGADLSPPRGVCPVIPK